MLTDALHAYDINHVVNPSYTGPLIQIIDSVGTTLDVGSVDGKVDRDAIVTFSEGSTVYLYRVYDQIGTSHYQYSVTTTSVMVPIYNGTSFTENEFGRISVETVKSGASGFSTPSLDVTGDFSFYAHVGPLDTSQIEHIIGGFGGSTYYLFNARENEANVSNATKGLGTPKRWIDDTDVTAETRGSLYTSLSAAGLKTIGVTGATYPSPAPSKFEPFRGSFINFIATFGTIIIYNVDTEASHTEITSFIDELYVDVSIPSVTFNDANDNPIVGANVTWITEDPFAATSGAWTSPAIVGSNYVTDSNGVATYDPNTDPAVDPNKVYTAVARYLEWDGSQWVPTMGAITAQNNVDLTAPV